MAAGLTSRPEEALVRVSKWVSSPPPADALRSMAVSRVRVQLAQVLPQGTALIPVQTLQRE